MQAGLGRARSMLTSFTAKAATISIGAVGGGAGIAGGLLAAAKSAANLGESVSKVRVVFGRSATGMIDQADDLAKRFGVVKQEALDAAAGFGLMGRAAGLSQEASAGLGKELVQLGLDMASFHNISNQEAFEKLRSGLAGEAEPLRPLGILLSEDAVKAEALAMGLTKVKRELTDQEKVVARLSLIRKQAGPAVGDLERTADSTANQMRRLEGELQNAAVDFGMKLQDALKDGISLARARQGAGRRDWKRPRPARRRERPGRCERGSVRERAGARHLRPRPLRRDGGHAAGPGRYRGNGRDAARGAGHSLDAKRPDGGRAQARRPACPAASRRGPARRA